MGVAEKYLRPRLTINAELGSRFSDAGEQWRPSL